MAGKQTDGADLVTYKEDSRVPCKYGTECYQKNPAHHEKYKHPPGKHNQPDGDTTGESNSKRVRPSISEESDDDDNGNAVQNKVSSVILPTKVEEAIKEAFLFEMPDDFYSFWSFCKSVNGKNPGGALKDVGLLLIGPYDLMEKKDKFKSCERSDFLRHWRYYFDPPEFQTIIKGDEKTEYHMGYYRDDPSTSPCFVASNSSAVDSIITPMAENIFGAVNSYLETRRNKSDPFHKMKINSLQKLLQSWAKDKGFDLDTNTSAMKSRARKVVAKTFHKAGIVVPVNKTNDVGYRPLIEKDADLKKILGTYAKSENEIEKKAIMNKLQPVITAANIANDECDFGTSLELGLDLFSFGGEMFHCMIIHLLSTAYSLLDRNVFSEILKAHLEKRQKGVNLSIID